MARLDQHGADTQADRGRRHVVFVVAGQEDDRYAGGADVGAQLAAHLPPVDAGHRQVEQDDVGAQRAGGLKRISARVSAT